MDEETKKRLVKAIKAAAALVDGDEFDLADTTLERARETIKNHAGHSLWDEPEATEFTVSDHVPV